MKSSDLHHVMGAISRKSLRPDKEVAAAHSLPLTTDNGESGAMSIQQESQPVPESHTTRFSKIVHDLAECFFMIRMAADVLGSLELGDKISLEDLFMAFHRFIMEEHSAASDWHSLGEMTIAEPQDAPRLVVFVPLADSVKKMVELRRLVPLYREEHYRVRRAGPNISASRSG